jgi:[glutamine synthetase] adenylyltransferase / [glutamine synthetase]-adenylyl-L-tyrosine phosphorylase
LTTSGSPSQRLVPEFIASADRIPFRDPQLARQNLARILDKLSPSLINAVPALLEQTPDPDCALILLERLLSESTQELHRLIDRYPFLAHYAITVFGHSRFLGETLIRNGDLFQSFLREKNLDRSFSREEFAEALARFRSRSFETDTSLLLARFKRREYIRIMLRDVLKIAPLAETTAEISALADALIEDALREAESQLLAKFGLPQHLDENVRLASTPFAVLSLGKLGGRELNYCSDVDLLYLYGNGSDAPESSITNHEYFIRLAQQVTDILSRVTVEGPVFRIDLRLRPQGHEGELAISLAQALRYYSETAHDWELQALIKVRCSAGNTGLAREFIRSVQPNVYSPNVNFAAIKTALVSREKMHIRRKLRPDHQAESIDVKIDHGGIRDIEFLVQCLQRVYGGAEPWLRSGGTLFSLQKLHDKGHLTGAEFHDLSTTYELLRQIEHRLQLRMGQQTHRLPANFADCEILSRSVHLPTAAQERSANIVSLLQRRMATVSAIYRRVIFQQQARKDQQVPDTQFQLQSTNEAAPSEHSYQQVLERLASDAPVLYELGTRQDLHPQARKNLFRFLGAAFTSSERYATLLAHAEEVHETLVLFEHSEYLTDVLVRHPEEIASLVQTLDESSHAGSGYLFETSFGDGRTSADPVFEFIATSAVPPADKLALLRRHYRHRTWLAGAHDLIHSRDVYSSLAATTSAAEEAIATAVNLVGPALGLTVMALGRLGSSEFDLLSDADLLFVCEDSQPRAALTKAVEQIIQALAAYTQDGMVFPVDTRLRPHGAEGELLISSSQLASYFSLEAQPWEALMYTKLRYIAGSKPLGEKLGCSCRLLLARFAEDPEFSRALREMRTRLESSDGPELNFKNSPGGAYDIDFMVGYLLIKHQVRDTGGTLRDRLWRCAAEGILEKSEAAQLDHAAELLRTVEHVVRLVLGRTRKWLPASEHARHCVEQLTSTILKQDFRSGLQAQLEATMRNTRRLYDQLLPSP